MSLKPNVLREIEKIVGKENYKTNNAELYAYATDSSIHRCMPDAVVRPGNVEQVSELVKLANKYKIPIIPRGAGTALCGHSVPIEGGISVDMQSMKKVIEIKVEDWYCVVQPGIVYQDLNKALKPYKFFFPPDPGSGEVCTIGGMVIANASGTRAVKYGATRDYVMGLEVVFPTGEIARIGTKTLKDSSGYQLARLFVGSEGTLGIVTEITLKVIPLPKKKASAIAIFNSLEDAGKCVGKIISYPLLPSALELMDNICIKAVNKAQNMNLPEVDAALVIEVDGEPEEVTKKIELISKICKDAGAIKVDFTEDEKEQLKLWKARKAMIPSLSKYREDLVTVMLADDMAVPVSRIPEAVKAFHEIAEKYGVLIPTYGHAGDGNLHTKFLIDAGSKAQWDASEKATAEVYDVVLKLGGTVTGEHGVSITKAPFFHKERKTSIDVMKRIKRALDPNNIMNPHKMMDWENGIITHLRYAVPPKGKEGCLKEWEREMYSCTYCGYCKGVCPIFKELYWDFNAARGFVLLSYGVLEGDLPLDKAVADSIYRCTLCKDCTRRCETSIKVPEIVMAARAELVKAGLAYEGHKTVVKNIEKTGNIFGDTEVIYPIQEGEVTLFIGCQYLSRPNRTRMYIKILEKLSVKPKVQKEVCCGFPMMALGFRKELNEQKEKVRKIIGGGEVVTLCPTCTYFLKEGYGINAKHVLQVILDKLDENKVKKQNIKATFHDPCDLARGAKIIDEPRKILNKIGVEIVEMEQSRELTRCCGGGGGMLISDSNLSSEIAKTRVRQALGTKVDTLITSCATCEQVLKQAATSVAEAGGDSIAVREISDILWKALV